MKQVKVTISAILLVITTISFGQEPIQQLIGSSGETFKNTHYQLDWSVGEVITESFTGSQNTLTQGFHQGKYTITALEQAKNLQFEITAFPNPATDFVILKIESQKLDDLSYLLTDVNGKILQDRKIESNQQQINLSGIAAGAYFLNVKANKKPVKTFKIKKSK